MIPQSKYLEIVLENFRNMKTQAERAFGQLTIDEIHFAPDGESNSIAVLAKHISGNLKSRFSSFLSTDGEKPDRKRDGEFDAAFKSEEELLQAWNAGWDVLFQTLDGLTEEDLSKIVYIRNEPFSVLGAIQRSIVHTSGHVGQIVYIAKMVKDEQWKTLSIPRGKSEEYTQNMMADTKK